MRCSTAQDSTGRRSTVRRSTAPSRLPNGWAGGGGGGGISRCSADDCIVLCGPVLRMLAGWLLRPTLPPDAWRPVHARARARAREGWSRQPSHGLSLKKPARDLIRPPPPAWRLHAAPRSAAAWRALQQYGTVLSWPARAWRLAVSGSFARAAARAGGPCREVVGWRVADEFRRQLPGERGRCGGTL